MTAPDSTSAALSVGSRPGLRLPTQGFAWWCLVVVTAALTARLTMVSPQLGCTAALVVLTAGLYVRNRSAGLVAAWSIWLLAPFLRRVFFLDEPIETADPLALAPFLATAVVVTFELTKVTLSRRSRRLLLLIVAGYAIGIPFGFLSSPLSAAFGLFAYLIAAGCFVIGYRERDEARWLTWPTVLMIVTPFLSLYAFRQYYLPLPEWDDVWFKTADINSAGSPEEDRIRPWSTLNSPGTFALILSISAVVFVTARRLTPLHVAGALAVIGALALTYVRSAWVALVVAVLSVAVVTRGAAIKRVAPVIVILAILGPVALGGSTGAALSDRLDTFGALGQDESTQERLATPSTVLPAALALPLGRGVGQAGEATRLTGSGFRYTDNGYLSLMFQVGPFGFVLVMAAIVMALRSAVRNAWRHQEAADVMVLGVLAVVMVMLLGGDQLYGVGGMIFWFTCGLAVRRSETSGAVSK